MSQFAGTMQFYVLIILLSTSGFVFSTRNREPRKRGQLGHSPMITNILIQIDEQDIPKKSIPKAYRQNIQNNADEELEEEFPDEEETTTATEVSTTANFILESLFENVTNELPRKVRQIFRAQYPKLNVGYVDKHLNRTSTTKQEYKNGPNIKTGKRRSRYISVH